jgi:hypothetical protein
MLKRTYIKVTSHGRMEHKVHLKADIGTNI